MKEYAIYPFKVMNISQNWNQGNHIPHWKYSKDYSDKPWDEALKDSGREYFIPQNDFIIEEVIGLGNTTTNSVRLKSVNKLYMPYKSDSDYLYLTLTHMNEDNLKQVSKGQILKKGSMILLEGNDGFATGNHFHITANLGKYYGLLKNSNGAWCYTYEKSLLPEEAFYVDRSFTNIIDSKGSIFTDVPLDIMEVGNPVLRNEEINQLEVNISNLRCRNEPSLDGKVMGYIRKGLYNYNGYIDKDGYVWYDVGIGFIAYDSNWITLYPKKEIIDTDDNNTEEEKPKSFFKVIIQFLKRLLKFRQ